MSITAALTALAAAKPFIVPARLWFSAMGSIGQQAGDRLRAIDYHLKGASFKYRDGAINVLTVEGHEVKLHTGFKQQSEFDALQDQAIKLAADLKEGIEIEPFSSRPTYYKRSGFRIAWPITCNVYYSPDWENHPIIDLGAISA